MNNNNQIPNSNNYNNPNTFNPQTNQFNQNNQNLGFYQQNTNSNYNMQPNISPNQNFQTNQFNQQGVYYEQQNTITPQPIEEKPPYNPQPTPNEPIIENSTPSLNELNVLEQHVQKHVQKFMAAMLSLTSRRELVMHVVVIKSLQLQLAAVQFLDQNHVITAMQFQRKKNVSQ